MGDSLEPAEQEMILGARAEHHGSDINPHLTDIRKMQLKLQQQLAGIRWKDAGWINLVGPISPHYTSNKDSEYSAKQAAKAFLSVMSNKLDKREVVKGKGCVGSRLKASDAERYVVKAMKKSAGTVHTY